MLQGTGSHAGKSVLAAGLYRLLPAMGFVARPPTAEWFGSIYQ
jgi:cobyric acid synthase